MLFTDDVAQIHELIRDELRTAEVSIFEWKSSDQRKVTISFSPGTARATYGAVFDAEILDQIAAALAERFSAHFR